MTEDERRRWELANPKVNNPPCLAIALLLLRPCSYQLTQHQTMLMTCCLACDTPKMLMAHHTHMSHLEYVHVTQLLHQALCLLLQMSQIQPKEKWKFLQKYWHKGAFFQETSDNPYAKDNVDDVYTRDYSAPTGEDKLDKSVLPKVMQVCVIPTAVIFTHDG